MLLALIHGNEAERRSTPPVKPNTTLPVPSKKYLKVSIALMLINLSN